MGLEARKKLDFGQPLPLALDLASISFSLELSFEETQPLFERRAELWLSHWFFHHLQAHPELSHSTRNALTDLFVTLKEQL